MRTLLSILLLTAAAAASPGPNDDGGGGADPHRLASALKGIGAGVEALQSLGMHDEAARLAKIARALREKLGATKERAAAKQEIEILLHAHHAYREAVMPDRAELVERAIRVRKLRLEDADRSAVERADASAPRREQLQRLLANASELWTKYGHERKAAQCAELARRYAQHGERRGEDAHLAELEKRLDRSRAELAALEHRLAELKDQLARLNRAR
jgi:hypothetical protein